MHGQCSAPYVVRNKAVLNLSKGSGHRAAWIAFGAMRFVSYFLAQRIKHIVLRLNKYSPAPTISVIRQGA